MTPTPYQSAVRAPIVFDHVWKHYRAGANHDSLRDAIPALMRRLVGRNGQMQAGSGAGDFWALNDVSFHVKRGETLGIIGKNGAGKSTILKLLSKITRQTRGTITVRGRLAALIELGGGFHMDLSGAENIYLQGTMLGLSRRQITRQFDSIVAFSELEAFLDTPVKRYSSGMVVRLGFAIAAHIQPDVLLLDEVLAVGDLAFQQKCFKRIAELKALGTTMVFISHNLEAVQKLCDRVLLLAGGRVVADGDPAEMIREYRAETMSTAKPDTSSALHHEAGLSLRAVRLRDAVGLETNNLQTGQPLQIAIDFHAHRPIAAPVFQVTIERLDGLVCHRSASRQHGVAPEALRGEGTVMLDYPALNLLPNFYQVIVEVFEGQNPIPVAALHQGCFFQIQSDRPEQGAVHLEHRWTMHPVAPIGGAAAPGT